jgi:hypothetical protein
MGDSRELTFSDDDMRLYGRLDIARRDLYEAMAYGAFILKKGWKAKPWSRGSTYLQQSAFVTSMVVAYGRAFTESRGWGYVSATMRAGFDADEAAMHAHIMKERHELYAHSQSSHYPVKPWKSDYHSDIIQFQVREIAPHEIEMLQVMCRKVAAACDTEQTKIKAKYL